MIKSIDEAVKNSTIKLDLIRKFKDKSTQIGPPPNPCVDIDTCCDVYGKSKNDSHYMNFEASDVKLGYDISTTSHIAAWVLFKGDRGDKQVQHLCGVRHCSNPDHLTLGYHKKNGKHASKTRAQSKPDQDSWKLSHTDKIEIRNLAFINGWPVNVLAEEFEVTSSTIYRILNEK